MLKLSMFGHVEYAQINASDEIKGDESPHGCSLAIDLLRDSM